MKVAVIGGSGTLGAPLVERLAARGDEVRVLSRTAPAALADGVEHRRIDLSSGEGLAPGLEGVETVVDASNSLRGAKQVLVEGTRRVLRAGAEAGVRHHVGISIVGCDRVPTSYYAAKVAQEEAIAAGELPWTLLRATQFHPLLAGAFAAAARLRLLPTGSLLLQPVDHEAVAERLADAVHAEPAGRLPDLAGPEALTLSELARSWRAADGRLLLPVRVLPVGRALRAIRAGGLCTPDAPGPGRTFAEWLADA